MPRFLLLVAAPLNSVSLDTLDALKIVLLPECKEHMFVTDEIEFQRKPHSLYTTSRS
jgi:hypothetical protein